MERSPSIEQAQRRAWLVDNLKRGYDDPDVKKIMQAWFAHQELVRRPKPGSEIDDLIEYAFLLKDAGFSDAAWDALSDARRNARSDRTGDQDMIAKIEGLIDAFETEDSH